MITKQVKRRRLLAVIASTIVGLILTGCGGTSVPNPDTGEASSSAAEAALNEIDAVAIQQAILAGLQWLK